MASHHADRTLLLVRGHSVTDDKCVALSSFMGAGGDIVAHVGGELRGGQSAPADAQFASALATDFELQVTVSLPSSGDQLTFWKRRPPARVDGSDVQPAACGVLDVRLELVDMEAPDWAGPPRPQEGPFKPEIGGRSIHPTMSREAMRQQFEASLPDDF